MTMNNKIKANEEEINMELMEFISKKSRVVLTFEQKLEIINFIDENPKISQDKVASHFSVKFKCSPQINRSTVYVTLKNREKFENQKLNKKKDKAPSQPQLEKCLMLWYSDLISQNTPLCDNMFTTQAKKFGAMIGISDLEFNYSKGWLEKFKHRNNIFQRVISGEAASFNMEVVKANIVL